MFFTVIDGWSVFYRACFTHALHMSLISVLTETENNSELLREKLFNETKIESKGVAINLIDSLPPNRINRNIDWQLLRETDILLFFVSPRHRIACQMIGK